MIRFSIRWVQISNGYSFNSNYTYDGCGVQKGYDLIGWALYCLRSGQADGFRGKMPVLINPKDYPEFADMLYQKIDKENNQL